MLRRGRLQVVEGALHLREPGLGQVGVDGGGVEALVTEQGLDGLEAGASLDEVGGESVSERARSDVLQDAGLLAGGAEGALDAGRRNRLAGPPALTPIDMPPGGL